MKGYKKILFIANLVLFLAIYNFKIIEKRSKLPETTSSIDTDSNTGTNSDNSKNLNQDLEDRVNLSIDDAGEVVEIDDGSILLVELVGNDTQLEGDDYFLEYNFLGELPEQNRDMDGFIIMERDEDLIGHYKRIEEEDYQGSDNGEEFAIPFSVRNSMYEVAGNREAWNSQLEVAKYSGFMINELGLCSFYGFYNSNKELIF